MKKNPKNLLALTQLLIACSFTACSAYNQALIDLLYNEICSYRIALQDCANNIELNTKKSDYQKCASNLAEEKYHLVEKLNGEIAMQEFLLTTEKKTLEQIEQELAHILATAKERGVLPLINNDTIASISEKIKHLRNAQPHR